MCSGRMLRPSPPSAAAIAPHNILFSGQLIERKNIGRLLEVYEEVLRHSPTPVGLIVIGQGPLKDSVLERKRAENLEHSMSKVSSSRRTTTNTSPSRTSSSCSASSTAIRW